MSRNRQLQYNAILQQRPAAIFRFFNLLVENLMMTVGVSEVLFVYPQGPAGPFIDYYELEAQIAPAAEYKTLLLVRGENGKILKLPLKIFWGGYILSQQYPGKPASPEFDLYDYITTYSIAVVDAGSGAGKVVLDSYDHHTGISTHPHHKHSHESGGHGPAEDFSGLLADMLHEICRHL